jgi:hypothetical protein
MDRPTGTWKDVIRGTPIHPSIPPAALKQISDMYMAAQKTPEMQAKYVQSGMFPVGTCGEPFGAFLRNIVPTTSASSQAGIKTN